MGGRISTPTRRAMIKTGTYTGDGNDNRNIDIGIDIASKSNAYAIIKCRVTDTAKHRIEYGQGDLSMCYNGVGDFANAIQSFTNTGFQVGTHVEVNLNGNVYRYMVFWQEG